MKTSPLPVVASVRSRAAVFCLCVGSVLSADTPEDYENVQWIRNIAEGGFDFSWNGRPEHYYFVEMSTDLSAGSWSFFPYATKGDGGEAGIFLSLVADRFFLRLRHTDDVESPLLTADFNQSGFSNRDQLDMGTDPFGTVDADASGIPDDIEAFWAQVAPAWKLAVVNDPNAAFYDPDGAINSIEAVLPGDDYDGDGRSNVREYLDGSDPVDYFNGETAALRVLAGDGMSAEAGTFINGSLYAQVTDSAGTLLENAPVRFSTIGGYAGLARLINPENLHTSLTVRTQSLGAAARYKVPPAPGSSQVIASIPGGQTVTFTFYTVDAASASKAPIRNFQAETNGDGTTTYTWISDAADGDWFQIESRQPDGSWSPVYQTIYGSTELPFVPGQNTYSLTINRTP